MARLIEAAILKRGLFWPFAKDRTPLQVLNWTQQRAGLAFTGSTDRLALPSGAGAIEISATENCYINFGDSSVEATSTIANDGSRLFMAGVQVVPMPVNSDGSTPTHMAVIQVASAGIVQVERVE